MVINGLLRWRRLGSALMATALLVAVNAAPAFAQQPHRVQPGETLSEIAERYGIPLSVLAAENQISNVDMIYAGSDILVPVPMANSSGVSQPASTSSTSGGAYQIQAGDTLWGIASLRGATISQLLAANPEITDPHRIYINQTITLPGVASGGAPLVVGATGGDIPTLLAQHAAAYGVDVNLVKAIAWQESGWQQGVVSSAGAIGVMQVMPDTGAWIAADVLGQPLDISGSVSDNIIAGVAYLRWLIDRTGSMEMALAGYYQGPGNLEQYGVFPETNRYIANVLAIRTYIVMNGEPPR